MARPFREECSRVPAIEILGEVPNGAADARLAVTCLIPEDDRAGVLRDCRAMAATAAAVAALPRAADMEDEHLTGPIDARAFASAIDRYRYAGLTRTGKDLSDQRISPLDVMLHVCRIVDRLLEQCGFATAVPGVNKPSNEFMSQRAAGLVALVERIAEKARIDLAVLGPATAGHKAAMERLLSLHE